MMIDRSLQKVENVKRGTMDIRLKLMAICESYIFHCEAINKYYKYTHKYR